MPQTLVITRENINELCFVTLDPSNKRKTRFGFQSSGYFRFQGKQHISCNISSNKHTIGYMYIQPWVDILFVFPLVLMSRL